MLSKWPSRGTAVHAQPHTGSLGTGPGPGGTAASDDRQGSGEPLGRSERIPVGGVQEHPTLLCGCCAPGEKEEKLIGSYL